MKSLFREPSVEVLHSYNGKLTAWKVGRPYLKDEEVNLPELEVMDLPLNSFATYHLKMVSSILFRDLLFTMRPIAPWARSLRTVKFNRDELRLSGEYQGVETEPILHYMVDEMYELMENGMPQDLAKNKLPMATSTEFSVSIDDRTLVAFLKLLRNHCSDLYEVYGKLILDAIGKDDSYVSTRKTVDIYNKMSVSRDEYEDLGKVQEFGSMVYGVFEINGDLMAQFIRQHYSTIKNELYNRIDGSNLTKLSKLRCDDPFVVSLYADKASFKKVVSVRSSWFAKFDMEDASSWSSIIGPYVEDMTPQEFFDQLPSPDSYIKDMEARIEGIEVNPPCPLLLEMPSLVAFRKAKFGANSRIFKKWEELVENNLIPDNPENPYRKRYEEVIAKNGLPE